MSRQLLLWTFMVFVKFGSPIRRSEFECVQQFCVFVYNEHFSLSPVSLIVYYVVNCIFKSWQFSWTYSFQQQNFVKQYYDNIMTVFFWKLSYCLVSQVWDYYYHCSHLEKPGAQQVWSDLIVVRSVFKQVMRRFSEISLMCVSLYSLCLHSSQTQTKCQLRDHPASASWMTKYSH